MMGEGQRTSIEGQHLEMVNDTKGTTDDQVAR